jgi:hypothetical protein
MTGMVWHCARAAGRRLTWHNPVQVAILDLLIVLVLRKVEAAAF